MTNIAKETVKHSLFVAPISIGATPTALDFPSLPDGPMKGVLIKAPGPTDDFPNTSSVFLGRLNVTADQTSTGGFPLAPGESIVLPLDQIDNLYGVAADANQKLNCVIV